MEQQNTENLNLTAVNIHGNSGVNLSKNVHANDIYEENGKRPTLRPTDTSMKRVQDSEICSNQALCASLGDTSSINFQNQFNQEKQITSYVTSTPKKETRILDGIVDYEILPSQMILDDPLLSSVDDVGNLTDHANSPASNDECEDDYTSLYETRMKAHFGNSKRYPLMSRFMNDILARQKIDRSQSFSGTVQQHSLEPDPTFVRKNFYDIPVSPKLKSRVRQRLFTLVNSIDGYKGQVNIEEEEENVKKFTFKRIHSSSKKIQGTQTESNFIFESNGKSCKSSSVQDIFEKHKISEENMKDIKDCKCHSQEFNKSNFDQQQHKSELDQTYLSTLSKSISERYGSAISSMLESQMKTIQLHQEQLNQEKFNSAMQKKDQENHTRVSFYQEKSHQMIQVQEAEYKVMSVREEMTKSCEQKIMEVLLTTKEKSSLLEKQHEAHVLQLNSVISKLKDSNLQYQNSQPQKIITEQEKNLPSRESLEKEVILLRTQLQQSQYVLLQEHRNFKTLLKRLAEELANSQEHHKQMMLRYQASLERERSSAVSEAISCKEEETRVIVTELKSHYENSLRNVHAHGRAQIDEYKKAVQFLKRKLRKMEEG